MKLSIFIVLIALILNLVNSFRIQSSTSYDPVLAPQVLRKYLDRLFNASQDTQKLLGPCLTIFMSDPKAENLRKSLFDSLETTYKNQVGIFKLEPAVAFVDSAGKVITSPENKDCGNYLKAIMITETALKENTVQTAIRQDFKATQVQYSEAVVKKSGNLISHFINDRQNTAKGQILIKKLNGNGDIVK